MKTIFAVVVLLVCVPTFGTTQYQITDLGTLGGRGSWAYGINESGQIVGQANISSSATHPFLYSNGVMTDLGTLGGVDGGAYGINESGQVVGYTTAVGNNNSRAFLYSGGVMKDLGTLGGSGSCAATGINDGGQVAGYAYASGNVRRAFLYSNHSMQNLGRLGSGFSAADGVNNDGQVVGTTSYNAFLYSSGSMHYLDTSVSTSNAHAINNNGQVVGDVAKVLGGASHAFLYSGGGPLQDLGALNGSYSYAYGINDDGLVVGTYGGNGSSLNHAFLYYNGFMSDLNTLASLPSGWTITEARAINNSGQIVGWGVNYLGWPHAFLLTPTPEPATLGLLCFGLLSLRRRQ